MIELTERAAKEVRRWQKSHGQTGGYLQIEVREGGCSGLYYDLAIVETVGEHDRTHISQGITIVVNANSSPYLQSLKLDYAEDLMGGGFRFQNPHVSKSCGCGISFQYNLT
ncbi:MAG: hypothetical protein N5P05_000354 [Chroococcopsis gigantea SAG 12.99]|jgi:iron-sulfur cluster assembly protein|nr:hypothetical protein [Chroococcopsis gigantea SAG 12.99]